MHEKVKAPPAPKPPDGVIEVEESMPGEQTQVCQAFHIGITENHPDLPAALVFDGAIVRAQMAGDAAGREAAVGTLRTVLGTLVARR